MTFLHLTSSIVNIVFGIVIFVYIRRNAKLEKKLAYTEACLERADENNRRMLEVIDAQRRN